MTEGKSYAIGIDLGTTYSCVGVFKDGAVKIIHNDHGSPTTASYVAFTQEERLIGDIAKTKVVTNPHNTVFDAKRLIGRKFNDGTVQEDMKHWPFTVINDKNRPKIEVVYKGTKKVFTPEEISSMVLTKMKETAETYLRQKVKDAVITVPAYFNDAQRQATKDAAAIAGLNVLRIINEPTAAGIAYALDEKTPKQQNILIYDLGGGTFDVTVMTIKNGNFHVKATAGDTHLGGEDFDNCLVNYFVREFKRLHNKDLTTNPRALRRLRVACERAKRVLSHTTQATIESESLCDGIDFFQDISRSRFDELCVHLFKQTLEPVEKALKDAKMDKSEIDEIVLVGGSTRIPKVQKLLSEFFGDKTLNKTLHPDEAVAWGAAVEAAILNGDKSKAIQDVVITDITPYSLGIECTNDVMSTVIKRNSSIPIKVRRTDYDTSVDYQEDCLFAVYEGEDPVSKNNRLLGKFSLWGIRKALQGEVKFEVTFEIDRNGILDVSATERGSENSGNITITSNSGYLTREEIDEMTKNESHYRENDRTQKLIKEARNRLESLI